MGKAGKGTGSFGESSVLRVLAACLPPCDPAPDTVVFDAQESAATRHILFAGDAEGGPGTFKRAPAQPAATLQLECANVSAREPVRQAIQVGLADEDLPFLILPIRSLQTFY